jgi:hypothetical protein
VSAKEHASHAAGLVEMREGSLQSLAAEPQQPQALGYTGDGVELSRASSQYTKRIPPVTGYQEHPGDPIQALPYRCDPRRYTRGFRPCSAARDDCERFRRAVIVAKRPPFCDRRTDQSGNAARRLHPTTMTLRTGSSESFRAALYSESCSIGS